MINTNKILSRFLSFLFLALVYQVKSQTQDEQAIRNPSFLQIKEDDEWVVGVMNNLTPRERLAQLFFIDVYSNRDENYNDSLITTIDQQGLGGLIFFQGGPERQAQLTNRAQMVSKVPVLVSMDAEWGLGMRLDSVLNFPYQMTLGAIRDNALIVDMGKTIGKQMNTMGVHVNYAPVVDINNNPKNPVINFRSFGSNPQEVSEKAIAYMRGMQDQNILATAKHFPGHGDTDTDSHIDLPLIAHNRARLDSVELLPFRDLIQEDVGSIMVAHLNVPDIQDDTGLPTSLDPNIVQGLLKDSLNFKGLAVTDALNMKGVTKVVPEAEIALKALIAGNDILLFPRNAKKAMDYIMMAVEQGTIKQQLIDERCLKVLRLKKWVGLNLNKKISQEQLISKLNNDSTLVQIRNLYAKALTLLTNKTGILPLKPLDSVKMASVSIGVNELTPFQKQLSKYTGIHHFNLGPKVGSAQMEQVINNLSGYDQIIVGIHSQSEWDFEQYGITKEMKLLVNRISESSNAIIVSFINAYAIDEFENISKADALLLTYQDNIHTQELAAQTIFGGLPVMGKLPVDLKHFKEGEGNILKEKIRLGYELSRPVDFSDIDSLILDGIRNKAFPGCQLLVAKKGNVIYERAYGNHTYADTVPVSTTDLYDLASLTKILGPLPVLMKLIESKDIFLDKPWKSFFPSVSKSQMGSLTLRDILSHRTGLPAEVQMWRILKDSDGEYIKRFVRNKMTKRFNQPLSEVRYLNLKKYRKRAFRQLHSLKFENTNSYVYSGIPFLLFPKLIEDVGQSSYVDILRDDFLHPLGMDRTTYLPKKVFPISEIIPTEFDFFLRDGLVRGNVHDENAFLMGGISGNSGLFACANDLAKMLQMYLNGGMYGGHEYLSSAVIEEFASQQFCAENNRRGLGFDKPECNGNSGHVTEMASQKSYGHSGFTGTYVWVDPEQELIYIFLSNRIYPTRKQRAIYDMNIRTNIHKKIYEKTKDL